MAPKLDPNANIRVVSAEELSKEPRGSRVITSTPSKPFPLLKIGTTNISGSGMTSFHKAASIAYLLTEEAREQGIGRYYVAHQGLGPSQKSNLPAGLPTVAFEMSAWSIENYNLHRSCNHWTRVRSTHMPISPPNKRTVLYPIYFGPTQGSNGWSDKVIKKPPLVPEVSATSSGGVQDGILFFADGNICVISWVSEWRELRGRNAYGKVGVAKDLETWKTEYAVTGSWLDVHKKIITMCYDPKADTCAMSAKELLTSVCKIPMPPPPEEERDDTVEAVAELFAGVDVEEEEEGSVQPVRRRFLRAFARRSGAQAGGDNDEGNSGQTAPSRNAQADDDAEVRSGRTAASRVGQADADVEGDTAMGGS